MLSRRALLASTLATVSASAAEPDPVREARKRLQAEDFAGALKMLRRLTREEHDRFEPAEIEAVAHLGLAMVNCTRASEAAADARLSASATKMYEQVRTNRPDDDFLKSLKPALDRYTESAREGAAHWPNDLINSLSHARLSVDAADRAARLASGSGERTRSGVLVLWAHTYQYLAARDAVELLTLSQASGLLAPETVTLLKKAVPDERGLGNMERDLRRAITGQLNAASSLRSSPLARALGDCTALYCGAMGKLRTGPAAISASKYTRVGKIPAPPAAAAKPVVSLPKLDTEKLLSEDPARLVAECYRLAAESSTKDEALECGYSLYLANLLLDESEALRQAKEWERAAPSDPAIALECARVSICDTRDAQSALRSLQRALTSQRFSRGAFTSVPAEVTGAWRRSPQLHELAPLLALTYAPLFQLISTAASDASIVSAPEAQSLRIRLAQLLTTSDSRRTWNSG